MQLCLNGVGYRQEGPWFKSNVRTVKRQGLGRSGSFGRLALQLQRRENAILAPRELALTTEELAQQPAEPLAIREDAAEASNQQIHKSADEIDDVPKHGAVTWWNPLTWSPRTRGLILLNLLVVLAASNWVIVKDVEESFDAVSFAAIR